MHCRCRAWALGVMTATWTLLAVAAMASTEGAGWASLQGRDRVEYIVRNFYSIYSQDLQQAVGLTAEAATLARTGGWQELEGFARTYHGVAQYLSGKHEEAIHAYMEALAIFSVIGSDTGKGRLYNEIAVFYAKQGRTDRAHAALDSALQYARIVADSEAIGTSLNHRAAFLRWEGKAEEAHALVIEVLRIRRQMRDSIGLGYVYLDLAEYELNHGRLDAANALVRESIAIRQALGDRQGLAVSTVILGENYMNTAQYAAAIPYFEDAIRQALALDYRDLIRFAYAQLQRCHLELGDHAQAYTALQRSHAYSDSIYALEKAVAIAEIETRYQTAKQAERIAQLDRINTLKTVDNQRLAIVIAGMAVLLLLTTGIFYAVRFRDRVRRKAQAQEQEIRLREVEMEAMLRSQEAERKRLAADIHDGLGQYISALSLALSSLRPQVEAAAQDQVAQAIELTREMQSEVRNVSFNLMPQVLERRGLVPALEALGQRLGQAGQVTVTVEAFGMPPHLPAEVQVAVFRIVQEWLANVLRYNVARHIQVSLTGHSDRIILLVEDDGIGFDSRRLREGQGNGWRNMQRRTRLIHGTLALDTQPGRPNNSLMLEFPLPPDTPTA